jgi:hypothetical protein
MGTNPSMVGGAGHGTLIWLYSSDNPLTVDLKRIRFSLDELSRGYGIPEHGPIDSLTKDAY